MALALAGCPPKKTMGMANCAGLVCAFVSPKTMAGAKSVIEAGAGDFTSPAVNENPDVTGACWISPLT